MLDILRFGNSNALFSLNDRFLMLDTTLVSSYSSRQNSNIFPKVRNIQIASLSAQISHILLLCGSKNMPFLQTTCRKKGNFERSINEGEDILGK